MDIVTQGIVGALAAQAVAGPKNIRRATWIGFFAGLPADADIIISSSTDSLLTLDFHRQFSHSLLFIPFGGLIVAALLWLLYKNRIAFNELLKYSMAGYATSGLLDCFTSYGTQLLWPFSNERIAWNIISVVDPIFSITIIISIFFGWRRLSPYFARGGWLFVAGYFLFGANQQGQAAVVVKKLAKDRGHSIERLVVKPTMGNLLVWRTVYQSEGRYYITAVRVSPLSSPLFFPGEPLPIFKLRDGLTNLPKDSTLITDIYRFKHFSDGYIAYHPENSSIIGDVRYSLLPFGNTPLWGITVKADMPDNHVQFENYRSETTAAMKIFPQLLTGRWKSWKTLEN
ncbi:MAG: metal-dependent hydrolase [Magnetococcales bacterium]|nr:metal-dependent hydrolase [Magnetococcales bacterium]